MPVFMNLKIMRVEMGHFTASSNVWHVGDTIAVEIWHGTLHS